MRSHRTIVGVLAALCLLAAFVSTAAALSSIGLSPSAITASGTNTYTASFGNIICNMTLNGTLASRIAKVSGGTVGAITGGSIGGCTSGGMTVLALPWSLTYKAFAGTLPNITSLDLTMNNYSHQLALGAFCNGLYRGNITTRLSGAGTSWTAFANNSTIGGNVINRVSQISGFCPATMTATANRTITRVTATLH